MIEFKIDHIEKTARNRSIFFSVPASLNVTYFGDGNGFESVRVNDKTINAIQSKLWFVKKIPFMLPLDGNTYPAYIEVNVRWFKIKNFRLVVDNTVVYSEGEFDKSPIAATPVKLKDLSALDKPRSKKEAIFGLLLAAAMLPMISFFKIETEWNVPFSLAYKYFALPFGLIAIILAIKFPKLLDSQMGGPYLLLSDRTKVAMRIGLSLCFAFFMWAMSSGVISAINAYMKPGVPTFIKGTVEGSFESGNNSIITINTPQKKFQVPINVCMGRSAETGDNIEIAMFEGTLGIFYNPTNQNGQSVLDSFFLEHAQDGKWVRQSNIQSAIKLKGLDWLKELTDVWQKKCDAGDAASCRVASYYYGEKHDLKEKDLLEQSCQGNDAVGCYGLSLIASAAEPEKKSAFQKIFDICKTHQPTCHCYWDEFEKYIDASILKGRKSELCASGQRWACR